MNKKGVELTMQTIGIAILILLTVAVLAMVFSEGLRQGIKDLLGLGKQSQADIEGKNCESLFSSRNCLTSVQCSEQKGRQVPGNWPDCTNGNICCE